VPELNTRLFTLETNHSQFRAQMVQQIDKASTQLNNDAASSRQELAEFRRSLAGEVASIRTITDGNREAITVLGRRLAVMEVELKKLNASRHRGRAPYAGSNVAIATTCSD
jgi:ABC-type transporter Mla subunit MlaD